MGSISFLFFSDRGSEKFQLMYRNPTNEKNPSRNIVGMDKDLCSSSEDDIQSEVHTVDVQVNLTYNYI